MVDTFNFPYHTSPETAYPDNGVRVQLGGGYVFTSEPDAPDQRIWALTFTGYKYYVSDDGTALDLDTNAAICNLGVLEAFYRAHGTWKAFNYPHPNPAVGTVLVRFNVPLKVPKGLPGADGMVGEFDIQLIEVV
jgi:phage-related protein